MAHKNYHLLWPLIVAAVLARTRAQGTQPTHVTVFQRETVLLTCSGSTVRWLRLEQQSGSSQTVTKKIFSSPEEWHVDQGTKYDINGTYNLVINDARADADGGTYQCDTNENPNQLLNADLVVLESLTLDVNPDGHLTRGMTIDITCTARYGGPAVISSEQEPSLTLTLDDTPAFPTAQPYYEPTADGTNFYNKKLVVNYTLADDTPGRHLRCTLRSMDYELEQKEMLNIKFAPVIAEIEERQYNTSDSITCSAEGIPTPTVTWTRISGSMPESTASGSGQAVLTNLQDGDHVWMCTATNELDSVSLNVSFTVSGATTPEEVIGGSKVGIAIGLAIGLGVPIVVAIIIVVCLLMRRKKDKGPKPAGGGGPSDEPTDPDKPAPINNEHRPPRPRSDLTGQPGVNVNPNPAYQNTPVYPEQYGDSPTKPSSDKPGFGDLGVRPIHVGGSTPSLNRSYDSSQRESGTDDRFQGPNTSV